MLQASQHGYAVAAKIGEKNGVVSIWNQYEKRSKMGDDKFVVVMDFIEGETLGCRLATGKATAEDKKRWSEELCEALTHIHAQGVIHQDLKGANLMIDKEGHLQIIDFGLAEATNLEQRRSDLSLNWKGRYQAAPEQFLGKGRTVDPKHDIWATGLILWTFHSQDVSQYFKWDSFSELYAQMREEWKQPPMDSPGWLLKDGITIEQLRQSDEPSAKMALLIADMLNPSMDERPPAAEAHARMRAINAQGAGPA